MQIIAHNLTRIETSWAREHQFGREKEKEEKQTVVENECKLYPIGKQANNTLCFSLQTQTQTQALAKTQNQKRTSQTQHEIENESESEALY